MTLESRYRAIQQTVAAMSDFSDHSLTPSRQLFEFEDDGVTGKPSQRPIPKCFDVWTNLVGLPLPSALTRTFATIWDQVISGLSPHQRYYQVQPHTYHWELFIIKRPHETVTQDELHRSAAIFREILATQSPLTLTYRGFLITPDGTVLVKGYGEFDALRAKLRQALPWASEKQSQLGHISLGRLLDPVGEAYFAQLNQQINQAWEREYGSLTIDTVKWVHETQWYMEQHDLVETMPMGQSALQ